MAHRKSDQVPSSDRKTQIVKGQQDSKQEQHKQAEEERKKQELARRAAKERERRRLARQEELERQRQEQERLQREEEERQKRRLAEEDRRIREEEEAEERARIAEEKARKERELAMKKKYPNAVKYEPFTIRSLTRSPEQTQQLQEYIHKVSLYAGATYTGKSITGQKWRNPKQIMEDLPDRLLYKIKGKKNQDLNILLLVNDPRARLEIAQWLFLKHANHDQFKKLAGNPKYANTVEKFMNTLSWIESFVYAGANQNAAEGLEFLVHLVEHDPKIVSNPMKRKIATAIAAEFGRAKCYDQNGDDPYSMAKIRYDYYASSWEAGELNSTFDLLQDWDMRIVCGTRPGNSAFGSVTTLKWLRENCTLQEGAYPGAACQVPYRLNNIFGDSIHGPEYYKPFNQFFPDNYAKEVRDVGAVCGGNATFGTASACANGIAAITMGEPGHCAFAIRVENKWQRCFSISWEHSCHWTVWGEHQWSFLELTQEFFQEEFRSRLSMQIAALGAMMEDTDSAERALYFYELAADIHPFNYPIWSTYANALKKCASDDKKLWMHFNELACLGLAGKHPEVCTVVLNKYVYPGLLPLLKDEQEKITVFESFMKNLDKPETDIWPLDKFLKSQADALAATPQIVNYFKTLFGHMLSKPAYASQTLAWTQEYVKGLSAGAQGEINTLAQKSAGETNMDKGNKDKLQATAIVGAENNRDIDTFQSISLQYHDRCKPDLPPFEAFEGELLSSGGSIRFSSLSPQYDDPLKHWGVIESCGGLFHTKNELDEEWAEITMPKPGMLSGVIIVTTGANHERLHDWKIETSMDGNEWTTAGALPDPVENQLIRLDLSRKKIMAKYVRIVRGGQKDFLSLKAILVFGQKAA